MVLSDGTIKRNSTDPTYWEADREPTMDIYDQASDLAGTYSEYSTPVVTRRDLEQRELDVLIDHLIDTEMPIPDALSALHYDVRSLTIEDLGRVSATIARCSECRTWTRKTSMISTRCPDCAKELETSEEEAHAR